MSTHLPDVLRMLSHLLPTPADGEDVAQEACLHALLGLGALRRPELFGPWFRTIAYNRAMQWQRRRYAEAAVWPHLWQPDVHDGDIPDVAGDADLHELLALLAPAERDAVLLRYVEGWTSQEIGARQGAAPGTVRWRLHRALEPLRNALEMERSGDR